MDKTELLAEMAKDIQARYLTDEAPPGAVTFVGRVHDPITDQQVWLWRVAMGPDGLGAEGNAHDYITVTYIYNFWGDAASRGELADVIVANSVDGYQATDPADEMFPQADKA